MRKQTKRIFRYLKYIFILLPASVSAFALSSSADAQTLSAERIDAVLAGMGKKGGEPDLDAVLAGMGAKTSSKGANLENILASMTPASKSKSDLDGIIAAMSITNTLNYLDNAYSESNLYNSADGYQASMMQGGGTYPIPPGGAVLPISGRITSRFGFRPSFGRMHKGVDIALQVGDTVVAAIDGRVERVSVDPKGYGIFVCLRHSNGMETRYAHLSRALVTPGMTVYAGDPIALGGNTGNSTGPHLHFETRVNGTALDPTKMFDFSMPGNFRSHRNLAMLDQANPKISGNNYASPANANQQGKHTYIVKAGDTVASVAKKNGISVLSLCRLNMLSTNDPLQPGRMLKLR